MKTFPQILNLATSLTQNTTAANQALMRTLMDSQHRFLIQKYFDNERSFQTTTVGGMDLTLTATPSAGDTTATLTAVWAYPTVTQYGNFSNGDQRAILFTTGSASIAWTGGLTNAATTNLTTVGVQKYAIPAVISKITNDTVNVGQLRYVPAPVQTRQEWDLLNFLPYTSDIPNYFFIYQGNLEIWPIPSTTGNLITFNYKARVPDFSFLWAAGGSTWTPGAVPTDYTTGTIATATVGSTAITGTSTSWSTTGKFPLNTDVSFFNLYLRIDPPKGDGMWYPISQFTGETSLTLSLPIINAPSVSGATYTIGQMPLLNEDFHDMLPYGSARTYSMSIKKDESMHKMFTEMYGEMLKMLEDYAGSKTINVDLQATPMMTNPNLYFSGR